MLPPHSRAAEGVELGGASCLVPGALPWLTHRVMGTGVLPLWVSFLMNKMRGINSRTLKSPFISHVQWAYCAEGRKNRGRRKNSSVLFSETHCRQRLIQGIFPLGFRPNKISNLCAVLGFPRLGRWWSQTVGHACRSAESPSTHTQGSEGNCDPRPALLPWAAEGTKAPRGAVPWPSTLGWEVGQGPHLGAVLRDEEELSEGTVQGEEDARLCHVLKQAVLHVSEKLPQGF